MSKKALEYFVQVTELIDKVQKQQIDKIDHAAKLIAETICAGGLLHIFGSGHSQLLAAELFYRAGGLVPVNAILEIPLSVMQAAQRSTWFERVPEYGKTILRDEPIKQGDVIIIASNSGRNAVPIDAAITAKEMGATVIALTSVEFSRKLTSRHSSGKMLMDFADIILDNYGVDGDAIVQIEGCPARVSASSTVVCSAILQAMAAQIVQYISEKGMEPPIWLSANSENGDKKNEKYLSEYKTIIKRL